MTQREALFAAVCADPEADLPRLVMADHLDELGEWERAAFIRGHIADPAFPLPADPLVLLDPPDRDLFHLVTFRPVFARGFLVGVAFPDFGVDRYDPPIYPVDEVADDWHRVCDLAARHQLFDRVDCPGWFDLRLRRGPMLFQWVGDMRYVYPQACPDCGHLWGDPANCPRCDGTGHVLDHADFRTTREALVNHWLRGWFARRLFGDEHPLFR